MDHNKKIFLDAVDVWLNDKHGWLKKSTQTAAAFVSQRMKFSLIGIITAIGRPVLLSSSPMILAFSYEIISISTGLTVFGVLFVGNLLMSGLDNVSKRRDGLIDEIEGQISVRVGDLVSSIKRDATLAKDREKAIVATLGIIEGYARLITKSKKGQISVSLSLYNGTGTKEMRLLQRNPGSERPLNRKFQSEYVLGHHAVQFGQDPQIVHNIKEFGKKALVSPTGSSVNYKSILLFPVELTKKPNRKGFIAIDCKRKYAFFGSRAEKIVFMCAPLVAYIQDQI